MRLSALALALTLLGPASAVLADTAVLGDVLAETLARSQELRQARSGLDVAEGGALGVFSALDLQLQGNAGVQRTATPLLLDPRTDVVGGASASKRFSFGTTVDVALQAARQLTANDAAPTTNQDTVSAALTVRHNILRNPVDRDVLEAVRLDVAATAEDVKQAQNVALLNSVQRYWSYRVSLLQVEVLKDAERRANQLVVDTEALVKADAVPAAELLQLRANLTEKGRARRDAEHAAFAAATELAVAMGATTLMSSTSPPEPFPATVTSLTVGPFLEGVEQRRHDCRAAAMRRSSAAATMRFADWNLLPTIDVEGSVGVLGAATGPQSKQGLGHVAGVGLSVALPAENSASRGAVQSARGRLTLATYAYEQIRRDAEAAVRVAFDELETAAWTRNAAHIGVAQSRTALDNERIKRRVGTATGIDVVLLEDRLTFAMLEAALADARYAAAWASLQFASGMLDVDAGDGAAIARRATEVRLP